MFHADILYISMMLVLACYVSFELKLHQRLAGCRLVLEVWFHELKLQ